MLFSHDYQAGPAFEVFSPQGSNPLANWQLSHPKSVKKVYDKSVKGYVYSCPGRSGCKMQLPKDEHKSMALLQPFLVLQLYLTPGQPLSIELSVVDQEGTHRRLYLSTAFTEIKITPLHCQIPLTLVQRGAWVNLAVHVADLVAAAFKGVAFQAVNLLILSAVFKVRRIFTLKDQPPDPSASGLGAARSVPLPMQFDFPAGIATTTQVLDFARVHAFAAAASQAARSAAHRSGIRTPLGKMRPSVQIPRSTWEGAELVAEAGLPASPSSLLPAGKLHDGGTHVAFGTRVTAQAASPGHKRSRPSSGSHTSAMVSRELSASSGPGHPGQAYPGSNSGSAHTSPARVCRVPSATGHPMGGAPRTLGSLTPAAAEAANGPPASQPSSLVSSPLSTATVTPLTSPTGLAAKFSPPMVPAAPAMTSPAAGAGGGNQSGRRRQRLPTIKSVEERAGEASLSASPAMSSRRSPARRHSRGSAAMSQPRASFEVARAQSATPMRQNHSNLIQDSVVEGASVRSNIQATLDSIQLWPAKVSSSGRYSLTGGGEGAEAACGIENQVAVEDLPLTRLPSQSRAALAGRRPLYPVAEGHAGSQGQGQPGSASPSPTRDGKRASLTGQALRPSRTTLPTLTAGQQPPQQPSTSAITSAQQPASSPIDAIRALRSAQLAGASSLSPDSPAARRPARRATSPAHSPPSHPVHWPASQGSSARHSPEAPGTAWPSDSRAASQRPSPDSPAGASPELHMRRQFAGLHLDPLTQSTEAEASSFLERLSGQAAAASLGPTKKANAPTTVVAQPVAVSAMEESACVSALLQDVYENGNGTLSALLHARKHSNNQDSTSLTAFGSVELVTTRMDSGMRLMDDSSVLLGDSALLSRPASPGQPIPDVTPPGTAALQVSGYDHRHYTEGQSPRCKASPLAGSSGRQPAFCEGMTASLQQSLDIRGAGPGAGRTPPAWSSCDSLAPATLSTSHRAFTPPVIVASKVHDSPPFHSTAGAQDHNATWPVVQHLRLSHGDDLAGAQDDELMELIFDPILNCYYDAKTNQYYTLK